MKSKLIMDSNHFDELIKDNKIYNYPCIDINYRTNTIIIAGFIEDNRDILTHIASIGDFKLYYHIYFNNNYDRIGNITALAGKIQYSRGEIEEEESEY